MQNQQYWETCSQAVTEYQIPARTRSGSQGPAQGQSLLVKAWGLWPRSQYHQSRGTLPCTPLGLSREGGNVPNMASVLRASRTARAGSSGPAAPGWMTTSSTAPMPKALPRRPNLLALFPGISNDW